jgi:hypothetical protein
MLRRARRHVQVRADLLRTISSRGSPRSEDQSEGEDDTAPVPGRSLVAIVRGDDAGHLARQAALVALRISGGVFTPPLDIRNAWNARTAIALWPPMSRLTSSADFGGSSNGAGAVSPPTASCGSAGTTPYGAPDADSRSAIASASVRAGV